MFFLADAHRHVVDHGGTAWWVPVLVAFAAALASYLATWYFKHLDVNRENAFRAADLVDQAERLSIGTPTVQGVRQMGAVDLQEESGSSNRLEFAHSRSTTRTLTIASRLLSGSAMTS